MTPTKNARSRRQGGEGPVVGFFLGGARPGFLRGVRALLVVGWVLLLIGVAPTECRKANLIARTPSGRERDDQLSELIGLVVVSVLAPAMALGVLGYGVVPRSLHAKLGIGPYATALPLEEKQRKRRKREARRK